jgi:hypothetical protein
LADRPKPRAQRHAGAFLSPDPFGMIAVPSRTLADEYHDEPAEPADSERVPEPDPPGMIERVVRHLTRRPGR